MVRLGACKTDLSPPVIFITPPVIFITDRYFCGGSYCFIYVLVLNFVLLAPYVCFHIFN